MTSDEAGRGDDPSSIAVSVVVPTFQRCASVLRLCDALTRQTADPVTFELVVSIDGSTDGTRESLERRTHPYATRVIAHANRGRAAAINAGVAGSAGALVVLLDDDMEPSPQFVDAHRCAHEGGARRGVMGAVPITIDARATPAARFVADKFNGHLENLARAGHELKLTDFYSGNFSIRRALFDEVGGFDEDFRVYGNEDLELSYRLARAGIALAFDGSASARQYNEKSFAALARDRIAEGRTAVQFAKKHPEVFDGLKLGTYHDGPRALRAIRNGLLALGQRWSGLSGAIRAVEGLLARSDAPGLDAFYRLSLGYFFWTGARSELRERAPGDTGSDGLRRLAAELVA